MLDLLLMVALSGIALPVLPPDSASTAEISPPPPVVAPEIHGTLGLVDVQKMKRTGRFSKYLPAKRRYVYNFPLGGGYSHTFKIKGVPDLRPYEKQHPVWVKVQTACEHWHPVVNTVTDGAVGVGMFVNRSNNTRVITKP